MASLSSRSHFRRKSPSKLPPWAIVAICLAAAIILTVIVGNLLKLWLNDETYQRLTELPTTEEETATQAPPNVPNVHAYPFSLDNDLTEATTRRALSFSMNNADGNLQYTSPVALHQGRICDREETLSESIISLRAYGNNISGVISPHAFHETSTDKRYAVAAEEGALMREFLMMGGCEILICNVPFSTVGTEAILNYLSTVKHALGNAPLGVSVPLSVAQGENGGLLLERLLTVCDFCALDMTDAVIVNEELNDVGICGEADEALKHVQFYLQQYDMRLLLQEDQSLLISAAEMRMIESFQIISKNKN